MKKYKPLEDEETAYLLRSPKNERRFLESIAELEAGEKNEQELRSKARTSNFPWSRCCLHCRCHIPDVGNDGRPFKLR